LEQGYARQLVQLIGTLSQQPPEGVDTAVVNTAFNNALLHQVAKGSLFASRGLFWALSGLGGPELAETVRQDWTEQLLGQAGCTDPVNAIFFGAPAARNFAPLLCVHVYDE
jgi:hypothetical protein